MRVVMTTRRQSNTPRLKTTATTLGDLIAAAYDVSEGTGRRRAERAARLLTDSPLARRCSRRVLFVR
jgi:hypothetical protein